MTTTDAARSPAIGALAAFATSLRERPLPQDVMERAAELLADAVACAVFGRRFAWSRSVRAQTDLDPNAALPIADSRSPAARRAEALVLGVQAHAFELDSLRKPSAGVHPGATVALPALATACATDASGEALLRAIVAGCEVMYRIGAATLHTPEKRGFHAPGLTGPFGAAVATGLLIGLSEAQLAQALGIAASTGGGLLAFSRSAGGGMVKRLHLGQAAAGGVFAAQLAAAGFEGPETAIDGAFGLLEAYCDEHDATRLTAGLGETWEIRTTCIKRYACHVTAQPSVEALLGLMAQEGFVAGDIASISLLAPSKVVSHHGNPRPGDIMQAQYSLPFMLAAAAKYDLSNPRTISEALLEDEDVRALASRITLADGHADGVSGWATEMTVVLHRGGRFHVSAGSFPGMPDNRMSAGQLEQKFRLLVADEIDDPSRAFDSLISAANVPFTRTILSNLR